MAETEHTTGDRPDEFVARLRSDLVAHSGCDSDLARILAEHILVTSPQTDCVAKAWRSIGQLAKTRAEPVKGVLPDA